MAFIYEKFSQEDKEVFTSLQLPCPFSRSMMANTPRYWVSDREKNLFLVCLGGQGHRFSEEYPPTHYYLIWDRQLIKIEAYYDEIGNMKEYRNFVFRIVRLLAPNVLKNQSELLINIIKEAITEYERGSSRYFNKIEFIEISTPFFMEGDVRYE